MSKQKSKMKNEKKRPAWVDMYAKTQKVDARMGDSRDWSTDVPNIKLSRAFVVVLILHVVAVGGILAFEMFKTEPSGDTSAGVGGMAQLDVDQPAGAIEDSAQQSGLPMASDEVQDDGYLRYIVQSGDSLRFIADAYNISRTQLLDANNIDERHPLVQGRILRIPRALFSAQGTGLGETPVTGGNTTDDVEAGSGFIPLKSAGVIAAFPAGADVEPEVTPATRRGSADGDGFLPLGQAPQTGGDLAAVSKAVKIAARPRVLRERPATAPAELKRTAVASASQHTVVAGDTLYGISRKHGVSVNDLLGVNPGVTPRSLRIGTTLRIP
jgi:LysM repeat protein